MLSVKKQWNESSLGLDQIVALKYPLHWMQGIRQSTEADHKQTERPGHGELNGPYRGETGMEVLLPNLVGAFDHKNAAFLLLTKFELRPK